MFKLSLPILSMKLSLLRELLSLVKSRLCLVSGKSSGLYAIPTDAPVKVRDFMVLKDWVRFLNSFENIGCSIPLVAYLDRDYIILLTCVYFLDLCLVQLFIYFIISISSNFPFVKWDYLFSNFSFPVRLAFLNLFFVSPSSSLSA